MLVYVFYILVCPYILAGIVGDIDSHIPKNNQYPQGSLPYVWNIIFLMWRRHSRTYTTLALIVCSVLKRRWSTKTIMFIIPQGILQANLNPGINWAMVYSLDCYTST